MKNNENMKWAGYFTGSSYYPEQWEPSRWEDDFKRMQHLGFDVVRMGEFAWYFFEPAEGKFHFEWMDQAIEMAGFYEIRTVLCTPTASIPPWLRQLYPDVLGGDEKGPHKYGGRRNYCVSSPALRMASDRIVGAMAEHYGKNPHIIGWQLDNEAGGPFVCYDANCEKAFREWLKKQYGTLEQLNTAWNGAFWSNMYTDWNQIEMPGSWGPGGKLDYRRFLSDSYYAFLKRQADIIRQYNSGSFISTNWPNMTWSLDSYKIGGILSAVSWDNYPENAGVTNPRKQYYSGMNHDICRCAAIDGHFFTAEQASQVAAHALPEGVRLQSYINLAHGAYGQIYFEWRPPVGGDEQGYISVLQMDGSFGPACEQHSKTCSEMKILGPVLAEAETKADIAMLFSYDNMWAQGFWDGPDGYDYEIDRYYKGLKCLQRNIDMLPPSGDFSSYRLIAAPNLRIISDEDAIRLTEYVKAGGILLINCQCGTRDKSNRIREMLEPGVFAEAAGIQVSNAVSSHAIAGQLLMGKQQQGVDSSLEIEFPGSSRSFEPATVLEGIELKGAEPVAVFQGGRMSGRPAITVNAYGDGHVVYVGTDSRNIDFYEELAGWIGSRFCIDPIVQAPYGVEVTSRQKGDTEYVFLLNLTENHKDIILPGEMINILNGETAVGEIRLGPLDAKVLSRRAIK